MPRIHLREVREDEQRSPSGKYHSFARNLSLALGGTRNTGPWGGGHPFDVQIRRLPAGASICPHHLHLAQWELFLIRTGTGTVRAGTASHSVRPGDAFVHPPGEAHQLTNTGTTDLEVLIVADNPLLDAFYYPDSNKWGLRPPGMFFRLTPVDYFDGEESSDPPRPAAPAAALPAPATPFNQRHRNLADLPWEPWSSPKGRFRAEWKQISAALGAQDKTPVGLGGHPFDLELGRLAPGQRGCPYHRHATQWEFYLFDSGHGTFRHDDETLAVGPGDLVLTPPGTAHDFTNTGSTELTYLLVVDNPAVDIWHYPDSHKWGFNAPRKFFRPSEVDYFDGEE